MSELEKRLDMILEGKVEPLLASRYAEPRLLNLGNSEEWAAFVNCNNFVFKDAFMLSMSIQRMCQGANNLGSTCVSLETIEQYMFDCGITDPQLLDTVIDDLVSNCDLTLESRAIFPKRLLEAEKSIESDLRRINEAPDFVEVLCQSKINSVIGSLSKAGLVSEQLDAVHEMLGNSTYLLRGLPGSGKTKLIQWFLKALVDEKCISETEVLLLAPTNKAAVRATVREAERVIIPSVTIHKGLGFNPYTESYVFSDGKRLPHKIIVVDEVSLLGSDLLAKVLAAAGSFAKVVFVGDENQLLSIEPGDVVNDLIILGTKTQQLAHPHRSPSAHLNAVARSIINNKKEFQLKGEGVFLIKSPSSAEGQRLLEVVTRMSDAAQCDPINDIQFLALTYKGKIGADYVNSLFHSVVGEGRQGYAVGDKIIVDSNMKYFAKGDAGYVTKVSDSGSRVWIDVQGRAQMLVGKSISNISLAYCLTVHKSQGSEYDHVVLLLDDTYSHMITKRSLLTAITRAKKSITIIGNATTLKRGLIRKEHPRLTLAKL